MTFWLARVEGVNFDATIDTVPSRNRPLARASSSTSTNAASKASLLARRNAAIVSWSGCVLAAMKRAPMSLYVARSTSARRPSRSPRAASPNPGAWR